MAGKLKILCVEDDPDIRELFQLTMEMDGDVAATCCASGVDALAQSAATLFDVILLDVMMPDLDGPTTMARLRQAQSTAATPVIFVTAKATQDELQRLKDLGARGVISKPFDPATLLPRVRELLA
jgi:CheY-like chemotaxis protein